MERGQINGHAAAAREPGAFILHFTHHFGTDRGRFYSLSGEIKKITNVLTEM